MKTMLIRPGYMVSLRTHVSGGVSYTRVDQGAEAKDDGAVEESWTTTKFTEDAAEHALATKVRSKARAEVQKVCVPSDFGLLCQKDREKELEAAYQRAIAIADEFNKTARFSTVRVYMMKGEVASTDEQAARAIGNEVKDLVESMNAGIDRLDPDAIRDAADKAKKLSAMLDATESEKVAEAIVAARKAARTIVQRVQKEGEAAAIVLADIQRGAIEKARMAFLDLDDHPVANEQEALPIVNVQRMAELDLDTAVGAE